MPISINDFLAVDRLISEDDIREMSGGFGLLGGISVALLLRRMRPLVAPSRRLVGVTAQFVTALTPPLTFDVASVRQGALLTMVNAAVSGSGGLGVQCSAVFAEDRAPQMPEIRRPSPASALPLAATERFAIPPEYGPVTERIEVRLAEPNLPYAGGDTAAMCAWLRLVDPPPAADERLVILTDLLGPSYSAVLRSPLVTPTVEISVQLHGAAFQTSFDWVLVRAETTSTDPRGWLHEEIGVWDTAGVQLASARQLRVVR